MDRSSLREFTHKSTNFLSINDKNYKQWVFRYTFLELDKDLGLKGDITSKSVFTESKTIKSTLIAKDFGILAGKEEIEYFLRDADPNFRPRVNGDLDLDFKIEDGQGFAKGDKILEITGDIFDIMAIERTVINLLTRLSSIATFTAKIVDIVKDEDVLIVPTRKTLWGLLDKKACLIGGAGTHRLNLNDSILIKDNHLHLLNKDFNKTLQNVADSNISSRFIEIEVENIDEVLKAALAFDKFIGDRISSIAVIMMDNMSASDIIKSIELLKNENLYDNLLLEASGGINETNVLEYAKTGVDIISMGCLTNSVPTIDLSMKIA